MDKSLEFVDFKNALRLIYSKQTYDCFKKSGMFRPESKTLRVEDGLEIRFSYKTGQFEGMADFRVWYNTSGKMYQLITDKDGTKLEVLDFYIRNLTAKEQVNFAHYFTDLFNISEEEFLLFTMIAGNCIKHIIRLSFAQKYFVNRRS